MDRIEQPFLASLEVLFYIIFTKSHKRYMISGFEEMRFRDAAYIHVL